MHSPIHSGVMNRFSFTLSKESSYSYSRVSVLHHLFAAVGLVVVFTYHFVFVSSSFSRLSVTLLLNSRDSPHK